MILDTTFQTAFQTPPFSKIKSTDFKPSFIKAIDSAKEDIKVLCKNEEKPTFENTIIALENAGERLGIISSIFFNLNSAETSKELQQIAQEVSPLLTAHSQSVLLNEELFERIKKVYATKKGFTGEDLKLLEETYSSFARNGALLNKEDKEKLTKVSMQLSKLGLTFGEHILEETNKFQKHILNEKELNGLPDLVKNAAQLTAEEQNLEGWIFTLQYPSYLPLMKYANNRNLREEMYKAFTTKGVKGDALDNKKNVLEIVKLRQEKAVILGFDTYADFILENRMASSSRAVYEFLNQLSKEAKPFAEKEIEILKELAEKDGVKDIQSWDHSYFTEKLKQQNYNFDDELLKPYFQLENCVSGVFEVAHKLFDITFEEDKTIDVYHKDVKTYLVKSKEGEVVSILYTDFHPRAGKRSGAWMTSFRGSKKVEGKRVVPHVSIVCNFTKPTAKKLALLTFNELTTLFHEFGHALHGMLANTKYASLAGTNVYWDFVELPSQVLENWCYEKETLDLFAKHYETGEIIPEAYIEKIKHLKSFMEGYQTLRQVSFGLLDLNWHTNPQEIKSVLDFEKKTMKNTQLYPEVKQSCMSTAFSHIFQGGYAAGYYSYKWAEVLDADAFAYFKEKGIFNKEIATRFKNTVLELGGTQHPMELYKQFRGQEPEIKYLLRRAGLVK